MSKYIITKDLNKYRFNDNVNVEKYVNIKDNILKQADTIEGLCDRFVIVKNGEGVDFWKDFNAMKHYSARINIDGYDTVYGAIWTEKGLIYVAKMNNEGELELI